MTQGPPVQAVSRVSRDRRVPPVTLVLAVYLGILASWEQRVVPEHPDPVVAMVILVGKIHLSLQIESKEPT